VTDDEAARRAAGRRHYNSVRKFRREIRRAELVAYAREVGLDVTRHGAGVLLARRFGVSRATISRDLHAIFAHHDLCESCGSRRVVG
jgi:hypothetical protein